MGPSRASCTAGSAHDWEMVVGLEVHVQLMTRTKSSAPARRTSARRRTRTRARSASRSRARCRCSTSTRSSWRRAPRSRSAATVHTESIFARKNYFYPDLPKGYQISQFDRPLATGGRVTSALATTARRRCGSTASTWRRTRASRSTIASPAHTAIDLNRAGTPLVEIVSEPDLRSAADSGRVPQAAQAGAGVHRGQRREHGGGQPARRREHQHRGRAAQRRSAPRPRSRT